jgi:hypothetical protein
MVYFQKIPKLPIFGIFWKALGWNILVHLHKWPFGIFIAIVVYYINVHSVFLWPFWYIFSHYGLAAPVSRLRSFVSHQKIPPPPLNIPPGGKIFISRWNGVEPRQKKSARRILSERRLSDWSKDLLEEASQGPMLARHKIFVKAQNFRVGSKFSWRLKIFVKAQNFRVGSKFSCGLKIFV